MVYPLPDNLGARIFQAMMNAEVPAEFHMAMCDEFAKLIVRANREIIRKILELKRDFTETIENEEVEHEELLGACAGEETCEYIVKDILKPHTYHNTEKAKKKSDEIAKLIEDIFKNDPSV